MKIAANVSHGRIKTFNPCVFGLRRFEQYLPRGMHDTHQPVSLLSCLRVCSPCDVLWAFQTSPSANLLAENFHLMVADIFQFVADDPYQKNFVRDYFREMIGYWQEQDFRKVFLLKMPEGFCYAFHQFYTAYIYLEDWAYTFGKRCDEAKLYLVAQFAYFLHLDYKLDDSDDGFGDHLRKVIRKYLRHGDGYHFPLGLNHMKDTSISGILTGEWIPDED